MGASRAKDDHGITWRSRLGSNTRLCTIAYSHAHTYTNVIIMKFRLHSEVETTFNTSLERRFEKGQPLRVVSSRKDDTVRQK